MIKNNYDRTVALLCPVCGNSSFESESEDSLKKCVSCDAEFEKDELIKENSENIQQNISEIKDEVIADVRKQLKDAFKGNKFIKFK